MIVLLFLMFMTVNSDDYQWNTTVLKIPPVQTENCMSEIKSCDLNKVSDCPTVCSDKKCTVNVAIILPNTTDYFVNLKEAKNVLETAVNKSKELNIISDKIHVNYGEFNDYCKQEYATIGVISATSDFCAHVIFGPICDYCVATVGRAAKFIGDYGTPVITPGGFAADFVTKKVACSDEFYMVLNSGPADFGSFAEFFHLILDRYKWTKIALMYEKSEQNEVAGANSCQLLMSAVLNELGNMHIDFIDGDLQLTKMSYVEYFKNIVGVKYGIILLCTNTANLRKIVLDAYKLKMMDLGEYLFFNFEMYNNAPIANKPWYDVHDEENNETAEKAFNSVFTFLPSQHTEFDWVQNQTNRGSIYVDGLYDGMMLYAHALNKSIISSDDEVVVMENVTGYYMVDKMMGVTFQGKYKNETTNCNGQKMNKFAMVQTSSSGESEVVAEYDISKKTIIYWKVLWPSGEDMPSDTPKCGFDLSRCKKINTVTYLLASLISLFLIGALLVGWIFYRHFKFKREIYSMAWKIHYNDIMIFPKKPRPSIQSAAYSMRKGSFLSVDGYSIAGDVAMRKNVGYYKSHTIVLKNYKMVKIDLNKELLTELKTLHDLTNENLVKFYGACFEYPNHNCIIHEHCSKGSLCDVIQDERFPGDWSIRMSLIMDVVRGMHYLHSSALKSHGNLSSTNCLIDNRFSVKISSYGLKSLEKYEEDYDAGDENDHRFWAKQLWTAPEILRDENAPPRGTQAADVYSFAIIMHEIITREVTFYLGKDTYKLPQEIVDSVRKGPGANNGQPLRPYVENAMCADEIGQLMKKCWSEDSADRPNFTSIKNRLKQMNKDSDGNVINNLLQRMEQYANNLESLVEERTADYVEEKRKCEVLLYQLLPKSVAQQLISGRTVIAETFDSVTIYFSDIVGFTALSAQSTPLEVVDVLNDLYTCFDSIIENFDVYKVETIGDAYMVVSGLPGRNGNNHAREIARMSLSLLKEVKKFKIRHRPQDPLQLRIGIHTGPCVAGVVGLRMPRYCLFGDTVNTASRMESNGMPLKIHVSPVTKTVLDTFGTFNLECRGEIEMKGKGRMTTYWLIGEKMVFATEETKTAKYPTTPIPKSVKREMANSIQIITTQPTQEDEASVPLLSLTSNVQKSSDA